MDNVTIELMPNIYRLITVWIATGILFFFFYKFFWKAVKKYMQTREDYIVENVEAAKNANKMAQEYEEDANEALKQARIDSKAIIDRSKNEAIKVRDEIIETANNDAKNKLDSARLQIEREQTQAQKELEKQILDVALKAAQEIVKDNLDEKKSEEIVDDFIKELKVNG